MIKKTIFILTVFLVIGGVVYYSQFFKNESLKKVGENSTVVFQDVVPPEIKKVDDTTSTFIHKKHNFSFNYPSDLKVSNFREGEGEQILFQGENGDPAGGGASWFQIYITPWDEGEGITVDRIKQDLPDILIKEPQFVILGPRQKEGVGPKALIFFSQETGLGETREVWFVQEGNLYQITAYKKLDSMIGEILSTLVFE